MCVCNSISFACCYRSKCTQESYFIYVVRVAVKSFWRTSSFKCANETHRHAHAAYKHFKPSTCTILDTLEIVILSRSLDGMCVCSCCSFFPCTIKVIGNRNVLSVACMVRDVSNSMWNVRNDSSTTPNSKKVSGCVNTHAPLNECCIHAEFIMTAVCDNLIVIFRIWEPIAPTWNCPKI